MADVVPKEPNPAQEENINRVNLTGLTDEEIFGPSFLYEEPEMFTEKKSVPVNINQRKYNLPQRQRNDCAWCMKELYDDEICEDCNDVKTPIYYTDKQVEQTEKTSGNNDKLPAHEMKEIIELREKLYMAAGEMRKVIDLS